MDARSEPTPLGGQGCKSPAPRGKSWEREKQKGRRSSEEGKRLTWLPGAPAKRLRHENSLRVCHVPPRRQCTGPSAGAGREAKPLPAFSDRVGTPVAAWQPERPASMGSLARCWSPPLSCSLPPVANTILAFSSLFLQLRVFVVREKTPCEKHARGPCSLLLSYPGFARAKDALPTAHPGSAGAQPGR